MPLLKRDYVDVEWTARSLRAEVVRLTIVALALVLVPTFCLVIVAGKSAVLPSLLTTLATNGPGLVIFAVTGAVILVVVFGLVYRIFDYLGRIDRLRQRR